MPASAAARHLGDCWGSHSIIAQDFGRLCVALPSLFIFHLLMSWSISSCNVGSSLCCISNISASCTHRTDGTQLRSVQDVTDREENRETMLHIISRDVCSVRHPPGRNRCSVCCTSTFSATLTPRSYIWKKLFVLGGKYDGN